MKLLLAMSLLAAPGLTTHGGAATCESLVSLVLPGTTITLAQPVAAGEFMPPGRTFPGGPAPTVAFKDLPAFCRIAATLKPTDDSDIKIEVWLPASGWNGKFQAVGNGGWAGVISYGALAEGLLCNWASWAGSTKEAPKAAWSLPASATSRCEITESSWESWMTIWFGSAVRTWSVALFQCGLRESVTETPAE